MIPYLKQLVFPEKTLHIEPLPSAERSFPRTAPSVSVVALDFSGSMHEHDYPPSRREAGILAAEHFYNALATADPTAHAGAVYFESDAAWLHEPVPVAPSLSALKASLRSTNASGGTNMFTAFKLIWSSLRGRARNLHVIALTDGYTVDRDELLQISRQMKSEGVQIDCIGIGGSPSSVAEDLLRKIASTINGVNHYWFIDNVPDLIRRFESLAIRSFD